MSAHRTSSDPDKSLNKRSGIKPRDWGWIALLTLCGLIVRVLASRGDLWLDEIMSVNIARAIRVPADILLSADAHEDNNHPLNTLWLWLVQSHESFMLDRLLSVLAGAASIPLAWMFARRWSVPSGWIAGILVAGSFFTIHYGSEARGYSLLMMFTLLALVAIDRLMQRRTWVWIITFWVACTLGMLSQLAFIHTFMAVAAWMCWRVLTARPARGPIFRTAAIALMPPIIFIGWLYFTFIRGLGIAGANITPTLQIIAGVAASTVGFLEEQRAAAVASLVIVSLALVAAVVILIRRRDDRWVAMLMLAVGAPALCMIVLQPEFLMTRYFTVSIIASVLSISVLLGSLWQRGSIGRMATACILAAFLVVNGFHTSILLIDGRGQYREALQLIADRAAGNPVLIVGDHDFRESTIVDFYAPMIRGKNIQYLHHDQIGDRVPEFALFHSFDVDANPPKPAIRDRHGREFSLIAAYSTGPLSGWYWYVYQRSP